MNRNWICETLMERAAKAPQGWGLFDGEETEGLSNAKVLELSGRVYAYLKANGVGREDFVLINLPRGVKPLVAELGVWRAGEDVRVPTPDVNRYTTHVLARMGFFWSSTSDEYVKAFVKALKGLRFFKG